jgi:hypothetical protein
VPPPRPVCAAFRRLRRVEFPQIACSDRVAVCGLRHFPGLRRGPAPRSSARSGGTDDGSAFGQRGEGETAFFVPGMVSSVLAAANG